MKNGSMEHQPLARFMRMTKWMIGHIAIPVSIAMVAGLVIGYFTPPEIAEHLEFTVIIGLFWMLYPMMINLQMGKLVDLIKMPKKIGLSLVLNFVLSPLIIGGLVMLFLRENPDVGAGILLVGVSPCSAMNTAAAAFVGGSVEMTLGIIAVSYALTIIAAPFWITVMMNKSAPVPFAFMVRQIALVILIPMFAGWLTRVALKKKMGEERYLQIVPSFEGFSFLGVLFMIFFLFIINGRNIIENWHVLLVVAGVSTAFFGSMMVIGILAPKLLHMNYADSASITVTSVAKNESIAMALAFMLFGSNAALGVAIGGVLIQIPFMVAYIQVISKKLKKRKFYD
jgi:ACR3 family arsenite transporter